MKKELTIVIPCKNEEKYIGNLLDSLLLQSYTMKDVEIIISDANSTDSTLSVVQSYTDKLNIRIVKGGLPSVGRNNGAKVSESTYLLFIDSDIVLGNNTLIQDTIDAANKKNIDLITTRIYCPSGNNITKMLYATTNILTIASKYINIPFVTGMYFFIRRNEFEKLRGFPEDVIFAEDYALSKKIRFNKFKSIRGSIITTDRRFKTTGHLQMIKLFLTTMLFPSKTKKYFNYWNEKHD